MKAGSWIAMMVLVAGVAAATPGFTGEGKEGELQGEIVDSRCYLGMGKRGPEHQKCAVACAKDGIPSGILTSNGKLYTLLVPSAGVADYQAEEARIIGTIYEASRAVAPKKIEIKKDGKWVEVPLPESMM